MSDDRRFGWTLDDIKTFSRSTPPKKVLDSSKVFCPTGPGGGVDSSCGRGGGASELNQSLKDGSFNYRKLTTAGSPERTAMESVIHESMKELRVNPKNCFGYCALVSVDVHEKLGSPKDLKPTSVMYGEEEHVILYNKKEDTIVDPTADQYDNPMFPGRKESTGYKNFKTLTKKEIADLKIEIDERKTLPKGPIFAGEEKFRLQVEAKPEIEPPKESSRLLSPQVILGGPTVPQDKFIDYLKKHGQEYEAQPLPKGIKKGVMKQCYMNATKLAISKPDLTYVEGIAYTPKLPGMAVAHAWVVDKAGKVIDNTWSDPHESQYFGVPVGTTRLSMWMLKTKVYGIFGGADKASRDLIMSGEKP